MGGVRKTEKRGKGSLAVEGEDLYYPGRRVMENRRRSGRDGIPVDEAVWNRIRKDSPGDEPR